MMKTQRNIAHTLLSSLTAVASLTSSRSVIKLSLSIMFLLSTGLTATATINSISSDWCNGCLPGATHRIVAGKQTSMLVKGQFVDLSTRVEISGSGVSVSFGQRTNGSNSSVEVKFNVDDSATLGDRTVKLRYAVETSGPDTFSVQVVRGGQIDTIQQRVAFGQTGATTLVAANAIPINQQVTLVFSGSKIGNASIAPSTLFKNARILPGNTESHCEVSLEFTSAGTIDVRLLDAAVGNQPGNLLFKFFYGGAHSVTVTGTNPTVVPTPLPRPPIGGGTTSPPTFVDVAPRANILNLFRTTGDVVSINGQNFLRVDDRWCSENSVAIPATGNTSKSITLPDITWGVSNVGTAEVTVGFASELSSNGVVLQNQQIAAGTLHLGATQNFTFQRTRSRVRVIRFAAPQQPGCFVNPLDPDFFQDPPFTVKVDVNNAVPETATNRLNNSRNY
jgi:hypothetical protein